MSVVVVGGNTRNIGKTSVVAGLIAAMPERQWTAIKITQFGHGVCSANGEACECATADHAVAISEERQADTGTDTSRYLQAGAAKSYWVRTRQGQLHEAMPHVRKLLAAAENVVIESNSVLRFLKPDVALSVLDLSSEDFKESAMQYVDRSDAFVLVHGMKGGTEADQRVQRAVALRPCFAARADEYCGEALIGFVRERMG